MSTLISPLGKLRDNGDGSVADDLNGLIWMTKPYGAGYQKRPLLYCWKEAARKFGLGVPIYGDGGRIRMVKRHYENSSDREAYKRGSEKVTFSGMTGWRLPTIGEALTLFLGPIAAAKYKEENPRLDLPQKVQDEDKLWLDSIRHIFPMCFEDFYDNCSDKERTFEFWTANPSNKTILPWSQPYCAWAAYFDWFVDRPPTGQRRPVLLVRDSI